MSKVKFFLLALVALFFAATVSADVVWSSAFDFDGSEIVEPVVIPKVNQIGYSMALSSGTVNKQLGVIAYPEGGLDGREIFFTDDPNDEGTFSWNYINNPLFIENSNYTLKETIIAYDVPDVTYTRVVHILPEPAVFVLLGVAAAFFLRRRAKSLLVVLAFLSLGALGAKATTISVGKCFQMWPFERKVIINYTISDCSQEEYINFYYTTDNGESSYDLREHGSLTGDIGPISANGNYRVVWTPNTEDMATVKGKMKIGVDVYEEEPPEPPTPPTPSTYMVLDLSNNQVTYLDAPPEGGFNNNTYKSTKMAFRYVPPGTFTMGSPSTELGRPDDNSETQHEVTLTKGFYIGIFEVTNYQYNRSLNFMYKPVKGVNYSDIRGASEGARWPASNAVDSGSYLGTLRAATNLDFDLPTDAQWEYACRAGTTKALNNNKDLSKIGWCPEMDEVGNYSHWEDFEQVGGGYLDNDWGIYDMHGNVAEWCLDWYQENLGTSAVTDPVGAQTGTIRVVRGGSFLNDALYCRSAYRKTVNGEVSPDQDRGFRLVLVVD